MQIKLTLALLVVGTACLAFGIYSYFNLPNNPERSTKAEAQPEPTRETRNLITIDARRMWTDTGISLNQGDVVEIEASGEVNGSVRNIQANKWVGPNGWQRPPRVTGGAVWVLGNNSSYMCLIGRIGSERPFKVGIHSILTATVPGRLYLGVNDEVVDEVSRPITEDSPGWKDNAGAFTAIIRLGATEDRDLTVPIDTPWTNTQIFLKEADTLIINATGSGVWKNVATSNPNAQPKAYEECGPDGTAPVDRQDYYSNISLYQCTNAYKGALIGKIGEHGVVFPVGSKFSQTMKDAGTLYLGINDQKPEFGGANWTDNSGTFTVHITIERK
jgi:hypothetical protein